MKKTILSNRMGNFIAKQIEKNIETKPADIGTKPIPEFIRRRAFFETEEDINIKLEKENKK